MIGFSNLNDGWGLVSVCGRARAALTNRNAWGVIWSASRAGLASIWVARRSLEGQRDGGCCFTVLADGSQLERRTEGRARDPALGYAMPCHD